MKNNDGGLTGLDIVALLVAQAGAQADQWVQDRAVEAVKVLNVTEEDVKRLQGYTPEQKAQERARRKAAVQALHDAACEWLDVEERSERVMEKVNELDELQSRGNVEGLDFGSQGFDFGSVFGRGLE